MADASKRIDLAAPLLSVRRHGGAGGEAAGTAAMPYCKPGDTSGPVGHTVAVPFGWERRPGQPKSVRTRRPTPPPPPTTIAREEERLSDARSRDDMSRVTVSRCSVSGVSDDASACAVGAGTGVRGGGGVMMERFLPAAHAVAAGSPQRASRKAGPARPAASTGAAGGNGLPLPMTMPRRSPLRYLPTNNLPPNLLAKDIEGDDDDDDAESDVQSTRGFASTRCGLLPTRCVRTTLQRLNPAPAMRRRARRGAGRPFLPNGGIRSHGAANPLPRRSGKHTGGHDPGMQSWEELYIKSLLRSGRGGLTPPAATVATELDRTLRELCRSDRRAEANHPKASCHLGLLLVLDKSSEERQAAGETALLLPPPPNVSPAAAKNLRRGGATGDYGFPLLLEGKPAAPPGREIVPLLPLPSPKSPSESWLSRALPSVSTRPLATSFLGLHVQYSRKLATPPWCAIDPGRVVDHARRQQMPRLQDVGK